MISSLQINLASLYKINQQPEIKNKEAKLLTERDGLLIAYLKNFSLDPSNEKKVINNDFYFHLKYKSITEDLKILNLQRRAIYNRFKNFEKLGLIKIDEQKTRDGSKIFYHLTQKIFNNERVEVMPPQTEPKEKSIDIKQVKADFESARKIYPGTKQGFQNEWDRFYLKNKNNLNIVQTFKKAIKDREFYHKQLAASNCFIPNWKNFSTWLNQKCWDEEFPEIKTKEDPKKFIENELVKIETLTDKAFYKTILLRHPKIHIGNMLASMEFKKKFKDNTWIAFDQRNRKDILEFTEKYGKDFYV